MSITVTWPPFCFLFSFLLPWTAGKYDHLVRSPESIYYTRKYVDPLAYGIGLERRLIYSIIEYLDVLFAHSQSTKAVSVMLVLRYTGALYSVAIKATLQKKYTDCCDAFLLWDPPGDIVWQAY